jgi:hypothetical protein
MFPPAASNVSVIQEEDLKRLGEKMIELVENNRGTPPAGITYFGQFIDHDLTYDTTKLSQRDVEPNTVRNFRNPRFDLELVYGQGPDLSSELYESDGLHLKLAQTVASLDNRIEGGTWRDIGRAADPNRTPLYADPNDRRNLENLIVMQIHVLFMKFHNAAVDQDREGAFASLPLSGSKFQRAQQVVRWHYQWLVRRVFLDHVALPEILKDVLAQPKIQWHEMGLFIPAEFSIAAFRFGHSMVRAEYGMNCHHSSATLVELMAGDAPPPLREDQLFEWGRLFKGLRTTERVSRPRPIPSSPINTAVVEPLHHLPEYSRRVHSDPSEEPQPKQLTARTLLRGARANLPTGQEVANNLVAHGLLSESDILGERLIEKVGTTNDESRNILKDSWMMNQTPLYYYLLKEAEVLGKDNFTLGPMGSRIVAEVIETVLRADDTSYLNTPGLGPDWKPPLVWQFQEGGKGAIKSFTNLVQMLGDQLPHGCDASFSSRVNAGTARVGRTLVLGLDAITRVFR